MTSKFGYCLEQDATGKRLTDGENGNVVVATEPIGTELEKCDAVKRRIATMEWARLHRDNQLVGKYAELDVSHCSSGFIPPCTEVLSTVLPTTSAGRSGSAVRWIRILKLASSGDRLLSGRCTSQAGRGVPAVRTLERARKMQFRKAKLAENAADENRVALVPRAAMLLESMRDIGYMFESVAARHCVFGADDEDISEEES